MTTSYFFDSYAIMEILKGNPHFDKYLNAHIVLTKLNLFEVYSNVLRNIDEENADKIYVKYAQFAVEFDEEIIKKAAKLWVKYKKRNLSMTDCIGYVLAQTIGIKFLTGDKEFQHMTNVEFVT